MSEQEEKAAKWQLIEDYQEICKTISLLERQASILGETLTTLAYGLKNQSRRIKLIGPSTLDVIHPHGDQYTRIDISSVNSNLITELVRKLEDASTEKNDLASKLKSCGLNISLD